MQGVQHGKQSGSVYWWTDRSFPGKGEIWINKKNLEWHSITLNYTDTLTQNEKGKSSYTRTVEFIIGLYLKKGAIL